MDTKSIAQSYSSLSSTIQAFSLDQIRIITLIAQGLYNRDKYRAHMRVEKDLFHDTTITMDINYFKFSDRGTKKAIDKILKLKRERNNLTLTCYRTDSEDHREIRDINLFHELHITGKQLKLTISQEAVQWLMDFSSGYRKYEPEVAISLTNKYAIFFYILCSEQIGNPLTFSIQHLREILSLNEKYKTDSYFIAKAVKKAKELLDNNAPYSFRYTIEREKKHPQGGRPGIKNITIIPIYHEDNATKETKRRQKAQIMHKEGISPVTPEEKQVLHQLYGITDAELNSHRDNIQRAKHYIKGTTRYTSIAHLANELVTTATKKSNPKGYFFAAVKRVANQEIDLGAKIKS